MITWRHHPFHSRIWLGYTDDGVAVLCVYTTAPGEPWHSHSLRAPDEGFATAEEAMVFAAAAYVLGSK